MTTETIEQTPAEQRKAKAAQHVQKLTTELERLQKRKQTAAEDATRLHDEIAKAERAGAEPKTLTALRRERTEAEGVGADIVRVVSVIEQELVPARGELGAAMIACHADRYNALATKQCALTEVISEAITTIVETLKVKEGLAQQQYNIQMGDIGWLHPRSSPAGVRLAFLQELTKRLEDKDSKPNYFFNMTKIDWSCRPMIENGDLRPIK